MNTDGTPEAGYATRRWRRLALGCLGLLVAVNLAAFAVRAWFISVSGPYAATTGFEEFNLYHVWKLVHGHLLYEWPQKENHMLTHYNGAFYWTYAVWAKFWGAGDGTLVVCARWLTPFFGIMGMLVQLHLLRRLVPNADGPGRLWAWGIAFLTWFGPTFGSWLAVSVRADIPAVALSLAGLAAALKAREAPRGFWWIASSLLFFAAWGFKQYVVWILVGTVGQAIVLRAGWTAVAALTIPFGVLAIGAFAWGGEIYRYSILEVPKLYRWTPPDTFKLLGQAVGFNLFLWFFGAWAWIAALRGRAGPLTIAGVSDEVALRWRATALATVMPVLMGIVQLTPPGSGINNLFEGFVLIALLAGAAMMQFLARASRLVFVAGAGLLLTMAPLTIGQLWLGVRGVPFAEFRGLSVGNVIKLTPAQLAERRRFAEWMQTLPQPIWSRDAMLQLPWFATKGNYPAYLVDYQFETDAGDRGAVEGGGFVALIRQRRFAALLLWPDDGLLRAVRDAGYTEAPVPAQFRSLPNPYGLDLPMFRLYLRDSTTPDAVRPAR